MARRFELFIILLLKYLATKTRKKAVITVTRLAVIARPTLFNASLIKCDWLKLFSIAVRAHNPRRVTGMMNPIKRGKQQQRIAKVDFNFLNE